MRVLLSIIVSFCCLGCPATEVVTGADGGPDSGSGGMGGTSGECTDPPEGLFVVIEDGELDDADWEYTEAFTDGAMVATEPTGQQLSGGVDGSSYRSMTHQIANPDLSDPNCNEPPPDDARCAFTLVVEHEHIAEGATYTPSTDGAIDYIDYSESHINAQPAFEGAAVGWTFALWQAGTRYTYLQDQNSGAFSDVRWTIESRCGLRPEDFSPEPGPDFSDEGAEMTFGYVRSNTNSSPDVTVRNVHGIDEFRVVIVRTAP